ncbi:SlyX family protein [Agarivorans sp. MS3-6]|uniref:SlyX family protein n=1 Tax=Agarivorans sp. TSD2052 TaxID=2937286 RepID=UPI00200C8ED8|nr:SlyX family protein [Agarivorans sp. TSD2052]UPW18165.1 SlyX family protein [Agarivorans sp. TSD2052]
MNDQDLASVIERLETKLAFQEDTIEQLNLALQNQQNQLETLQHQFKLIRHKLFEGDGSAAVAPQEQETPPPHY